MLFFKANPIKKHWIFVSANDVSIDVLQPPQVCCNKPGEALSSNGVLQACNSAFYNNVRVACGISLSCNVACAVYGNDVFSVRGHDHSPTGPAQPGNTPGKKQKQVILKI